MRKVFLAGVFVCASLPAFAQGAPAPTPSEQAIGQKLMQEINAGLQCNAAVIGLQAELKKALDELAALKKPATP